MEQQFEDSYQIETFIPLLDNEEKSSAYQYYHKCYDAGNIYISSTELMLPTSLVLITFKSQTLGQRNEQKITVNCQAAQLNAQANN